MLLGPGVGHLQGDRGGLGARFTFTLPVADGAGGFPRAGSAWTLSSARGENRTRVLVVDDDPQTLRYVRDALSSAGYACTVTGDPEQVDFLLEREKPHLVLLDLLLPGTDGIGLMERLPRLSRVPVIFLSAYGRDQIIAQALEAGADDYIVKPFSPTELVARIQTVLRRRAVPATAEPAEPFVSGELTIDYGERRVSLSGRSIPLTHKEYRLLYELSVNAGRVVEPAPWVAEGELPVLGEGVQVIAVGHCSAPLRFYRHQSLSHWVYCQQGVLQRDHSQQAGFILLCECHLCREDLVLQPDHCPAYVHWGRASVGQPGPG